MNIVIIGNGIAGITAARSIRKLSNANIIVVSGESDYFFSRTALMYIYMGHMSFENTKPYEDWFWKKNKIELKKAWVSSIDTDTKKLHFDQGNESISYDKLILATGSSPNKFGWPGQDLEGVQSLYHIQDVETLEKNSKSISRAVIVGGGLIGVELAEMLHSRGIHVTYLIREAFFWQSVLPKEEASLINDHLESQGIELLKSTELKEIIDDGNGKVKGIITNHGQTIDCQLVGLTVGVHPNTELIKDTSIENDRGILVNDILQTNTEDVYAIGDCAQLRQAPSHRRPIEAVWYVGRMMGETIAQTVVGNPTKYQPGIWFNSAKFFDIEYQTYGTVPNQTPEGQGTFFWQNEKKNCCLRIMYSLSTTEVLGMNVFGIRQRHEVWDRWLQEKQTLSYVIEHLEEGNFDPEFFKKWEKEIQKAYHNTTPHIQNS